MLLVLVGDHLVAMRPAPCVAAVPDDREQPCALVATAKASEVAPGPEVCFLDNVLCVVFIAQEIASKRVRIIHQGDDVRLKSRQKILGHQLLMAPRPPLSRDSVPP